MRAILSVSALIVVPKAEGRRTPQPSGRFRRYRLTRQHLNLKPGALPRAIT